MIIQKQNYMIKVYEMKCVKLKTGDRESGRKQLLKFQIFCI